MLQSVEVQTSYSSPNIIRIMKSMELKREGHVAFTGSKGTFMGLQWESKRKEIVNKT
jgi:hypothetical protein